MSRPSVFRSQVIARAAGLTAIAGGLCVLAGQLLGATGMTRLGVFATPLSLLAGLGFVLSGTCITLAAAPTPFHRLTRGLGFALLLGALASILKLVFGSPSSPAAPAAEPIVRLLQPTHLAMAIAFACVGVIFTLGNLRFLRAGSWALFFILPPFWSTYTSLVANVYGIDSLNAYFARTLIPLPGAWLFVFVITGILASHGDRSFMATVTSRYIGGLFARAAFTTILLLPFTVGWVRFRALRTGTFDLAAAFSQFSATNLVVFGSFIWLSAYFLNRIDARRQKTLESLQEANLELKRLNDALEAKMEEQERTEEARKKAEVQLFQSQKMEAMGTLASGIAHDFNNILTIILLNAENARDRLPPEAAELRENLGEIRRAGGRAADLIRQIMTFGRRTPGGRTLLDPAEAIGEAVKLLGHTLPPSVKIRTEVEPGVPPVLVDATQLQQVLLNLGTNAAHAMADTGGTLEIRVRRTALGPERAGLPQDLRDGEYVQFSVRDTGHGMDEETLKRVFDPFFTTKPPGKGTGLGLAVVHGIMRLHEGAVTAYSEPGRGTLFNLYFPAAERETTAAPVVRVPVADVQGAGQHLLCVDDDAPVLAAITRRLERLGYRVTGCDDPAAALEQFRSRPRDFDLLLTDNSMPGMSGRKLAGEVMRIRPEFPVVLMSGFVGPGDIEAAGKAGIRRVVLKPDAFEELGRVLREVLGDASG